jgi:DNA replication protein DnaC
MVVTTDLEFGDWPLVLGEEQLNAALLDRLKHHAHIREMVGRSYCFRERQAKEAG